MSQLGEQVDIGEIDEDEVECPFNHDKPGKVKNELDTDPSKLGRRMGSGTSTRLWDDDTGKVKKAKVRVDRQRKVDVVPLPHEVYVALDHLGNSIFAPFSVAAHHLIPGEASLPESSLISYIEGGKTVSADIGYGVNGRENGIWLPTHHALSQNMPVLPFATEVSAYAELTPQGNAMVGSFTSSYTQAVMGHTGRQFHDDHTGATGYSEFVIKVLNKIQCNLVAISTISCQKCKDAREANGKLPPPHRLVHRLNAVSSRLAGFLTGTPMSWRPPVYTSQHAMALADNERRLWARGKL